MKLRRRLDLQYVSPLSCSTSIDEALAELAPGELIEVLTSDPDAVTEFRAGSQASRTDLVECSRLGSVCRSVLVKR